MKQKERTRRKLRKEFQAKQINVVAPADVNKPLWKVAVFSIACDINTVHAENQQEAVQKIEEGFGRHAGVEGPTMVGVACIPANSEHAKDFIKKWMLTMQQTAQKAQGQDKKIEVPKLVIAKS